MGVVLEIEGLPHHQWVFVMSMLCPIHALDEAHLGWNCNWALNTWICRMTLKTWPFIIHSTNFVYSVFTYLISLFAVLECGSKDSPPLLKCADGYNWKNIYAYSQCIWFLAHVCVQGIHLSIFIFSLTRFRKVAFTISSIDVCVFEVSATFPGHKIEKVELVFQVLVWILNSLLLNALAWGI